MIVHNVAGSICQLVWCIIPPNYDQAPCAFPFQWAYPDFLLVEDSFVALNGFNFN
jgi:hypothetical protein